MNDHSFKRNVPRGTLVTSILDALAVAYLVGFCAACLAGLQLLPAPYGILVPAALGALAVVWIVR